MAAPWVLYALLTMVLVTIAAIVQKRTLNREHAMEYSAVLAVLIAVISAPMLFYTDLTQLTWKAVGFIYAVSIVASCAFLFMAKAIRHMQISVVSPLMILGPAVTAVSAFAFLGEGLSTKQVMGLGALIAGTYILESKDHKHPLKPFKELFKSKYVKLVFGALFLYAISATFDKKLLGNVADGGMGLSATTYIPVVHIFLAINYLIMLSFFHEGWHDVRHGLKEHGAWILVIAILTMSYRFSQAHALTFEGSKVALVTAIKKTSGLLTTLIGGKLFHEKNLLQKGVACTVMLWGIIAIIA